MSEISKIQEVTNEAWEFYSAQKEDLNQLSTAIGNSGNPSYDPNDVSSTQNS